MILGTDLPEKLSIISNPCFKLVDIFYFDGEDNIYDGYNFVFCDNFKILYIDEPSISMQGIKGSEKSIEKGYNENLESFQAFFENEIISQIKKIPLKITGLEVSVINRHLDGLIKAIKLIKEDANDLKINIKPKANPYMTDIEDSFLNSIIERGTEDYKGVMLRNLEKSIELIQMLKNNNQDEVQINNPIPDTLNQKIMLANELKIIDYLDQKFNCNGNEEKIGNILGSLIGEKGASIKRAINSIKNKDKNDPYKVSKNKRWIKETLKELKIDKN